MKFILPYDIQAKHAVMPGMPWIEAGTYPVVRFFDKERVLIDTAMPESPNRQLTVVKLTKGTLIHDAADVQDAEEA